MYLMKIKPEDLKEAFRLEPFSRKLSIDFIDATKRGDLETMRALHKVD
jgi:hypothetical protein